MVTLMSAAGRRVRAIRLAHGLSLEKFAASISVSKSTLWGLEQGRGKAPTVSMFIRISLAYCVSLDHLLLGIDGRSGLQMLSARLSKEDQARLIRIAEVLHG